MKKFYLLIFMASGACFLLSSCSRLSNISVTKRHYRSGFYVDLGSRKRSVPASNVSETMKPGDVSSLSGNIKNKVAAFPEKIIKELSPVFISRYAEEKKQTHENTGNNVFANTQDISTSTYEQAALLMNYVASLPYVIAADTARSSDSAPMWVIILFAILIPPLGVALKFGITDKFWISLLLTLLFWLPGAIYSVIVVTQ